MANVKPIEENIEQVIPQELDLKMSVFSAFSCIADGYYTEAEALRVFDLTKEDMDTYRSAWEALNA